MKKCLEEIWIFGEELEHHGSIIVISILTEIQVVISVTL